MSTSTLERPPQLTSGDGGRPARRAVTRWAWRLFRLEWRRQALVLGLLIVAIAATIVGLGAASNASELKASPTFGTADTLISLPGSDPQLAADIAAIQSRFGAADVIAHQHIPIPGSVSTLDVRAESPVAVFGAVTLRLDAGRYPTGAADVAVTNDAAKTLGLHIGSTWQVSGRSLHVVGTVENPLDLTDQFALVAPGQTAPPSEVSILLDVGRQSMQNFRLPSGTGLMVSGRGTTAKNAVAALVLVLATLGLVFVGLLAVAGFTVMAHRRLRALGMFRALGATDRHLRLVMLANGAAVGTTAAVLGTALGLAAWFAFVPTLQSTAGHRVDPLALPWWAVAAAAILTVVTAVVAAWWPARAVARISAVSALSGRPPQPQPAHRPAALGGVLLAVGLLLLAFAHQRRAPFIIAGTIATPIGVLLLAPLAIRGLAAVGQRATIAVRLALRDLVRYQARSGAALGAVTLAVGIAATVAISAAAAQTPAAHGNLAANQLVLHLSPPGPGNQIPPLTAAQLRTLTGRIDDLAATLHADSILPLERAYTAGGPVQPATPGPDQPQPAGYPTVELDKVTIRSDGEEITNPVTLYVATPAVLQHYGIAASRIDPTADVVSSRHDLGGLQIFNPNAISNAPSGAAPSQDRPTRPPDTFRPTIEVLGSLPTDTSAPTALITAHAMEHLGLQPIPTGWLIDTPHPLTPSQIQTATRAAAAAGLFVETRKPIKSLAPLRNWSTAVGALVALGVLGMTVGLIRSETANDLRTLTATGASSTTRRTITGATSGALALLGAGLGTAGAYAALVAWHRSDLSPLGRVPYVNLILILAGLPVVATAAGWLLAGRQSPAIARQPLG